MNMKKMAIILGLASAVFSGVNLEVSAAEGTVNENNLRMRVDNNTNSTILGHLQKGEQVTVLSQHGKWLQVEERGLQYFVYKDYIDMKDNKKSSLYNSKKNQSSQSNTLSKSTINTDNTGNSEGFSMPTQGMISQRYGSASGQFGYTFHNGIDIANNVGTPVSSVQKGIVVQSGYQNAYGNYIMIKHNVNNKSYISVYAHLLERAAFTGQKVTRGQTIGKMGSTGNSTGSHLHFELHEKQYQYSSSDAASSVNPLMYLR